METIEVELLSSQSNSLIIRTPFRKYPGVVIQGDSLHILYGTARELHESCKVGNQQETEDLAAEIVQILEGYIHVYETTLKEQGFDLPYPDLPTSK